MSAQTQQLQQANLLTGRQMVMVATIALHALVIGALMASRIPMQEEKPEIRMIATFTPAEETPPPKPPEIPVTIEMVSMPVLDIPVFVPLIDVPETTALPAEPATSVAEPAAITAPPGDVTGTTDAGAVAQVASTALQYRAVRSADDYYPAASLRLEESGTAIVQVCVAPSGRLEGAPTIQQGSGSPRLDAAALTWAREALRFTPATRGGVPVSACKGFRVNFRLR